MSKVSISTFLILGVYLLFVSIMSIQITNAQEEVRKMNPHQKEALQLFSKSPIEQQQLEPTNDEAALKTLIQPKFQQNQQQQEKTIEQNNKQLVPFELFFNVQPAQSAGKVKSQQIEQELLQKLEQEKQKLEQKLQEQKNQGVSNDSNQIVNPSDARNIQAQSQQQHQQQEPTNDEAALKTLILQKLQIMQQEKKQQQLQQETNENDIQIVNPSNAKEVKAQSLQQQQQQQEDEEQNIKALELFFNTDTQQQQ
jgi:hypothetical protein